VIIENFCLSSFHDPSPLRPDWLWGSPSPFSGYRWPFSRGKIVPGVKLTTHFHPLPRSRMRGAILPLPQYIFMLWCSVKKAQGQLYLYLCLITLTLETLMNFESEFFFLVYCLQLTVMQTCEFKI